MRNVNGNPIIYMDNAATTRLCDEAFNAMLPFLKDDYGNPGGLYDMGQEARRAVADARWDIAGSLNAAAAEIYFTSGGTESDNWALKGVAELKPGLHDAGSGFGTAERYRNSSEGYPHIITTSFEHHAILETCRQLQTKGVRVSYVNPDAEGYISVNEIEKHICKDTVLISVMHVNNELGTIQPIEETGRLAHANGILFHTDAVASYGHIPIDVKAMNIDLLSAGAHKFSGPKGVGFLYVNENIKLPPLIAGGAQERGRRAGTENVPAIAGMAAAANKMYDNMDVNLARRRCLDKYFMMKLDSLNAGYVHDEAGKGRRIVLNGCGASYVDVDPESGRAFTDRRLPGTFSMTIPGFEAEELIVRLGMRGICISAGAACASSADEGSHVLAAIGLDKRSVGSSVRITINENNTEEEIDRLFEELSTLIYRTKAC